MALSSDIIGDRCTTGANVADGAAADPLGGRVGGDQLGVGRLDRLQLADAAGRTRRRGSRGRRARGSGGCGRRSLELRQRGSPSSAGSTGSAGGGDVGHGELPSGRRGGLGPSADRRRAGGGQAPTLRRSAGGLVVEALGQLVGQLQHLRGLGARGGRPSPPTGVTRAWVRSRTGSAPARTSWHHRPDRRAPQPVDVGADGPVGGHRAPRHPAAPVEEAVEGAGLPRPARRRRGRRRICGPASDAPAQSAPRRSAAPVVGAGLERGEDAGHEVDRGVGRSGKPGSRAAPPGSARRRTTTGWRRGRPARRRGRSGRAARWPDDRGRPARRPTRRRRRRRAGRRPA